MHKSDLAALDRKNTAELAPKHDENDGTEVKHEQSQQPKPEVKAETTVITEISIQQTFRRNINPQWLLNLNLIIQCRQVRCVIQLVIQEFDYIKSTDQTSMLGLSIVLSCQHSIFANT